MVSWERPLRRKAVNGIVCADGTGGWGSSLLKGRCPRSSGTEALLITFHRWKPAGGGRGVTFPDCSASRQRALELELPDLRAWRLLSSGLAPQGLPRACLFPMLVSLIYPPMRRERPHHSVKVTVPRWQFRVTRPERLGSTRMALA